MKNIGWIILPCICYPFIDCLEPTNILVGVLMLSYIAYIIGLMVTEKSYMVLLYTFLISCSVLLYQTGISEILVVIALTLFNLKNANSYHDTNKAMLTAISLFAVAAYSISDTPSPQIDIDQFNIIYLLVVVATLVFSTTNSSEKKEILFSAKDETIEQVEEKNTVQQIKKDIYLAAAMELEFSDFDIDHARIKVIDTICKTVNPTFVGFYDITSENAVLKASFGASAFLTPTRSIQVGTFEEIISTQKYLYIRGANEKLHSNTSTNILIFPICVKETGATQKVIAVVVIGFPRLSKEEEDTVINTCFMIFERCNTEFYKLSQHKYIEKKAIIDELTGIYNRTFFAEKMKQEFDKAVREKSQLVYILIDLDYFKQMNDTHGHDFGDKVLRTAAQTFKEHIRASDYVFRSGGDEFSILLISADSNVATRIANNIANAYREKVIKYDLTAMKDGEKVNSSFSVGIAAYPMVKANTPEELIKAADNVVYFVKEHGKNNIGIANS